MSAPCSTRAARISRADPQLPPGADEALERLRLQRMTTALHSRGPRPCGEVLAAALARLDPADRYDVLDLAARICAWPPEAIRAMGGDRYARPPLARVA